MHNPHYDDLFFTPKYIMGLKEEIRNMVELQLPATVTRATTLARIQWGMLERAKDKYNRGIAQNRQYHPPKMENKTIVPQTSLWRDRQLRDYRKANGLCFSCGEKFVSGHLEVYTKRNKPQANALVLNDLDRELSDDTLNELEVKDALHEEFCQLSLNALSSQENANCIKLKSRVKDKVMLVLLDSGSSHSFISSHFCGYCSTANRENAT